MVGIVPLPKLKKNLVPRALLLSRVAAQEGAPDSIFLGEGVSIARGIGNHSVLIMPIMISDQSASKNPAPDNPHPDINVQYCVQCGCKRRESGIERGIT